METHNTHNDDKTTSEQTKEQATEQTKESQDVVPNDEVVTKNEQDDEKSMVINYYEIDNDTISLQVNISKVGCLSVTLFFKEMCGRKRAAIILDSEEMLWLIRWDIPPTGTRKTIRALRNKKNYVVLEALNTYQLQVGVLSFDAWKEMKTILQIVLKDIKIVVPHITADETVMDRIFLKHLLLVCAAHRYQIFIDSSCKKCYNVKGIMYNHSRNHEKTCTRKDKINPTAQAREALHSVEESLLRGILSSNNMGLLGLSLKTIIGKDEEEMLDLLVTRKCFFPLSWDLLLTHIQKQLFYFDITDKNLWLYKSKKHIWYC